MLHATQHACICTVRCKLSLQWIQWTVQWKEYHGPERWISNCIVMNLDVGVDGQITSPRNGRWIQCKLGKQWEWYPGSCATNTLLALYSVLCHDLQLYTGPDDILGQTYMTLQCFGCSANHRSLYVLHTLLQNGNGDDVLGLPWYMMIIGLPSGSCLTTEARPLYFHFPLCPRTTAASAYLRSVSKDRLWSQVLNLFAKVNFEI